MTNMTVGVAWRSMLKSWERRFHYASINDLASLFLPFQEIKDILFVRLQYDECGAELDEINAKFGVVVHDLGVNLRDDLDEAAALMSALDYVARRGFFVTSLDCNKSTALCTVYSYYLILIVVQRCAFS